MVRILYNTKANNGHGLDGAKLIEPLLGGETFEYIDVTKVDDTFECIMSFPAEDTVIITGGDGTLNYLVNSIRNKPVERDIFYFPSGSGNDFWNDVKGASKDALLRLNPYLEKLPVTVVDGKEYYFINGVGYGIDGYCCEEGDRQRAASDKPINYTSIAIKGLLFKFKPRSAKITVDGKVYEYDNVWLAPVMNGRFYGGGMNVAPDQDRLNESRELTCVVMFDKVPLHALMIFPKIFKGELVNEKKHVVVLKGHDITVEFDKPCAMQIDGETFLNISRTENHSCRG
ncbi:MAG: diacylglycerol kinase family protein [Clostridia bacterium]|nr:diacylglycerol kinase family protein [Clostridia bacterium]